MSQPPPSPEVTLLLRYVQSQREHVFGILKLIDGRKWLVLTE